MSVLKQLLIWKSTLWCKNELSIWNIFFYTYIQCLMFHSSHFWFLVTFGDKVKKIRKYYAIFLYILQDKMGKRGKRKENYATKVTKIPKTKRWKYGMNETKVDRMFLLRCNECKWIERDVMSLLVCRRHQLAPRHSLGPLSRQRIDLTVFYKSKYVCSL